MDLKKIRADFPVATNCRYFQSAGMSPVPLPVLEKIQNGYCQLSEYGDLHWHEDAEKQNQMFAVIAGMIGCSAEDIAFAESNSMAMSMVALSLKQKNKDFNIVSLEEEFPSNSVPFEYQGIEMKYVPHDQHRYSVESILEQTTPQTVAVVCSYVQYSTGFRLDIATLGKRLREKNILFIVNATQAFPFFLPNMQTMYIDVLTCSVHKWCFCGHVGTLFVTRPAYREKYPSPVAGWLSVDVSKSNDFIHTAKNKAFDLWPHAGQYLFASANLKSRLGLGYAIEYLKANNLPELSEYLLTMSGYLLKKLSMLPLDIASPANTKEERSGIVSFSLKNENNSELFEYLLAQNIQVAMRNNLIRASVNIFTNEEDIDVLCKAVEEYINK
ncbi:MAG: hypothetical protein CVU05_08745 [Bacteroidetes bacterium HGW-Bacteroidetes-21]|nr:MAG: hypothetical protein CVU05_08745 [Bacteroidetes bacterium HGW-Bacteroidetes-21]